MRLAVISALLLTSAAPAMAATVLTDTFDGENGGASSLAYGGFANLNVTRGSVDLVANGDYGGLACFGGGGSCVDLGGTSGSGVTNDGRLTSKLTYSFAAGDTVTLSFQLSGNQRSSQDAVDTFGSGFTFGFNTSLASRGYNYSGINNVLGGGTIGGFSVSQGVFANDPYALRSLYFTAAEAGSFTFNIFSDDTDDFGPLLDSVTLDISPAATAVPEPATWGLMLLGFGLAGAALRRRHAAAAA